MIRGTTQNLIFNIGIDTSEVSQLWLTFSRYNHENAEIITKTIDDVPTKYRDEVLKSL